MPGHLKELTEIELNSVTDNPVIFGEADVVSGGNFHGQPLACRWIMPALPRPK
jgi:histidine ammonia-lyase